MTDKVHFTAPVYSDDLRIVMAAFTATEHDTFAVAYRSHFGEIRVVSWLTLDEAVSRARHLLARGYRVAVGPMDHVA